MSLYIRGFLASLLGGLSVAGCASYPDHDVITINDVMDTAEAERLTAHGIKSLQAGKFEKAAEAFQNAIAADETHGPAYNNLGRIYFHRRDLSSAARCFDKAVFLMPERGEPRNNLALTYEMAGRTEEAIALYEAALSTNPDNFEYLGNSVRARLKSGADDESVRQSLRRLLFLDTRPEWVEWADYRLMLLERRASGPSSLDPSDASEPSRTGVEESPDAEPLELIPAPPPQQPPSEDVPSYGAPSDRELVFPPLFPPPALLSPPGEP